MRLNDARLSDPVDPVLYVFRVFQRYILSAPGPDLGDELAVDLRQHTAVPVVAELFLRVDAAGERHFVHRPARAADSQRRRLARLQPAVGARHVKHFRAVGR